jgi:protein-L-isoaspartate(D-aspartate) O-methyltransferase
MLVRALLFAACLAVSLSCGTRPAMGNPEDGQVIKLGRNADESSWLVPRLEMVERQIRHRGVKDERVLKVMENVQRHVFVPTDQQLLAYGDHPLPIGYNQTISQPYIVALMTELLESEPDDIVLEIGTGSGYQAAVLAPLVAHVYSIEIVEPLCERARETLAAEGCGNVTVLCGDGYDGWPEHAPFDGIVLTAAPQTVPRPLLDQLAEGGRLVAPEGKFSQDLVVYEKLNGETKRRKVIPVRFVPMTGKAEDN